MLFTKSLIFLLSIQAPATILGQGNVADRLKTQIIRKTKDNHFKIEEQGETGENNRTWNKEEKFTTQIIKTNDNRFKIQGENKTNGNNEEHSEGIL